jgi:hypothetical protein
MIIFEGGVFKAWLSDKDAGVSCWLTAGDLDVLFKRVNEVCGGKEADWRAPRPVKQEKGKRG